MGARTAASFFAMNEVSTRTDDEHFIRLAQRTHARKTLRFLIITLNFTSLFKVDAHCLGMQATPPLGATGKRKRAPTYIHTDLDWPCKYILDEKTQGIVRARPAPIQMTIHQGKLIAPRSITVDRVRKMLTIPSPPASSILHKLPSTLLLEISRMFIGGNDVAALLSIDKTLWSCVRPLATGPL